MIKGTVAADRSLPLCQKGVAESGVSLFFGRI
jgi:hypothetical protein